MEETRKETITISTNVLTNILLYNLITVNLGISVLEIFHKIDHIWQVNMHIHEFDSLWYIAFWNLALMIR